MQVVELECIVSRSGVCVFAVITVRIFVSVVASVFGQFAAVFSRRHLS